MSTLIRNKPVTIPAAGMVAVGLSGVPYDDRLRGKVKMQSGPESVGFPMMASCIGIGVAQPSDVLPPGSVDAGGLPVTHGDGVTLYAFLQNSGPQVMSALLDVVTDA